MNKRIGNDLTFTWKISRKNESSVVPENFNGKDVEVILLTPSKKKAEIDDITINTGVISFVFKGKNQIELGLYIAVLSENKGDDNMVTVDTINAVTLVPHSYMEKDGDDGDVIEVLAVELTSTISTGGGGGIDQQQADWALTDNTAVDYIKNKPTLASVATSGSYNDLTNKPTIPAAQVQSNWNESDTTSKAYILNKPTIPTVPTNVSAFDNDAGYLTQHQDLTNYVQKSLTAGLLKNDGTVDTTQYLTQHQDISGKADKSEMSVVPGTGANADKTTITLKQGTSATVLTAHQDISGKENVTTIVTPVNATDETLPITTLTCEVGKYCRIDVAVDTLAITLPAMTDLTTVRTVVICLTGGATPAVTVSAADSKDVYYQDGFEIEAGNTYEINALFNGAAWIVAAVKINVE